jgi:hypothetical protein
MFEAVIAQLDAIRASFDASTLSGKDAAKIVDEIGLIRRQLDGFLFDTLPRVAESDAYGSARDAAHFYAEVVRATPAEGRQILETARKLEAMPTTLAAVRDGALSVKQAAMVADAVERNPGAEVTLLRTIDQGTAKLREACVKARAEVEDSAARATRQHAARELCIWTDDDGMVAGRFRLPPEIGGRIKAAIETRTQQIFRERKSGEHESLDAYAADALTDLVLGDGTAAVSTIVHVIVDHAVLVCGETLPGARCEIPGVGPVNVEWVRSLLGEAFVTAVIAKGKDITTVAHFGRHIPAELQTALIVGGRECEIAGCNHHGYLERDHVEEYAKGGITALWNLIWLCYQHHRRKTAGWTVSEPDPATGKRTLTEPKVANAP